MKLFLPFFLLIVSTIIVWQWTIISKQINSIELLKALLVLFPFFPYMVFCFGIIMGWRYNNAGFILTSLAMCLAYFGHSVYGPLNSKGTSISEAIALFLPINIAFFTAFNKKRIYSYHGIISIAVVALEIFVINLLFNTSGMLYRYSLKLIHNVSSQASKEVIKTIGSLNTYLHENLILIVSLVSAIILIFLVVRFIRKNNSTLAGYIGILIAITAGNIIKDQEPALMVFYSVAGIILIIAAIEASFSMAYMDDLTGLPGRRSLNEELINLGKKYSIAMVDIDHFKKFNDKYGHDIGDQVLKMIAEEFGSISGGAKKFRYGGEEFTAVFPGKSVLEATPHLEVYRKIIENTPFVIRNPERQNKTAKDRKGKKSFGKNSVQVTVSIGIAESNEKLLTPKDVIKAADDALYKAKARGRNRVIEAK